METSVIQSDAQRIIDEDGSFVWHPYTQSKTAVPPILISKAQGAHLIDFEGTRYFDAISSWWVTVHGHSHPYIARQIARQAEQLEQVAFADFTHSGAVSLAKRLVSLLNMVKARVFFSDNGSTAVEAALKIAIQYWDNLLKRGVVKKPKTKVLCFRGAYHGDTFGAMSTAGHSSFNRPFWPYLFSVESISPPYFRREDESLKELQRHIEKGDVAAFIFEPMIQGVAGMVPHSAEGLERLITLCHQYDVITIADEVMTGFGRTGPLFACERVSQKPKITCLSKGITGGFLPLGATICCESIFDGFLDTKLERAFLHGHSYCANPLACAAALASLDLFEHPQCELARTEIERQHKHFQNEWGNHPQLKRCDVLGTILAIEYQLNCARHQQQDGYFSSLSHHLKSYFFSHRIFLRPLGNVLYLIPPYCTSSNDLKQTYSCIQETLENPLWK